MTTERSQQQAGRPQPPAIRRILVPLDGSDAAEGILPLAERLARALHAEVVLARVVPFPVVAVDPMAGGYVAPNLYGSVLDSEEQVAREYLQEIAASFTSAGVRTQIAVRTGAAEDHLLELEQTTASDLVVLHTKGRVGAIRLLLGSITDAFISRGCCPVLTARGPTVLPAQPGPVLAPLDGSATAEAALGMAAHLAGVLNTGLHLLRVVEPGDAPIGAGAPGETDLALVNAQLYLDRIATEYGDLVVRTGVQAGAPADVIVRAAAEAHASLVVMGTHGRTGWTRARLGSVADQVVRRAGEPVLLVRAA